ncbi:MAG: hypothetical protein NTX00_02565 [Candidatus Parcubacteria bacterium]|nr:hypothetical protein [Candidatus Parcubacteria bacterium]
MLDDKDVQKLMQVFATRDEIKEMIAPLTTRDNFSDLQTAVDSYAKKADTYFQELAALRSKVNRLEEWITKIAKKVNIELTS